jgi:transposase-like protein
VAKQQRRKRARRRGRGVARNRGRRTAGGRNRYSEEVRREVAEFSILNGIHAAAKKFGVSPPSVTNWRKSLGISRATKRAAQGKLAPAGSRGAAAVRAGRGYSEDFRREVADYSIVNGIQNAAKKFKISPPSVTNWRRAFGITRAQKRQALASIASTPAAARVPAGDLRDVRKKLDSAFRALDRLLAKL